jgi:two-component system sensor histidine kinase BaeS
MLKSLRNRLILSHILPLMIIIPLMGIALVYVLETRLLLPNLTEALTSDAFLLSEIIHLQPSALSNPHLALTVMNDANPTKSKRVMLLTPDGRLLASTDPNDQDRLNQILDLTGLPKARTGQMMVNTDFSPSLQGEVIDVFAPVISDDRQVTAIVRVSYRYDTVYEQLLRFRYLIASILAFGLLIGSLLGSILALSIANPIRQVSQAIYGLARGDQRQPLSVNGPEEISVLVRAVKFLVERLSSLEQSRRQLLANLVHEIGRPLGALHTAIQVSLRGAKDDPQVMQELLDGMEGETNRLQRLLEDLSHLHDQVLGVLELDRQSISLPEWLPKVLAPWRQAARGTRLNWNTEIPSDMLPIQADPVRLAQIIGNLCSNAIKYTPVGGTISVTAGIQDEMAWIKVSDDGPGISLEEQHKIFDPFFRGEQRQRIKQGMGLGLSIARDLAVAHGGRIELESTPGLGSHFTLWLPLATSSLESALEDGTV